MTKKPSLLVVEATTAGGLGEASTRADAISIEGLAMVKALIIDALTGGFEVHAMIMDHVNTREITRSKDVHWHVTRRGDDVPGLVAGIAPDMDFCFCIAPEFGGWLERYTSTIEASGTTILSQPGPAVVAASDKLGSLNRLEHRGIKVPPSQSLKDFASDPRLHFPLVVKPRHGAGCVGVMLVREERDLKRAVDLEAHEGFFPPDLICQEFIDGKPLSASFIATGHHARLLGINEQDISLSPVLDAPSKYSGGVVGPGFPGLEPACTEIGAAMHAMLNLHGYFGFDFIKTAQGEMFVVEINPRLTTSFVGFKEVVGDSMLSVLARPGEEMQGMLDVFTPHDYCAYKIIHVADQARFDKFRETTGPPGEGRVLVSARGPRGGYDAFVTATGPSRAGVLSATERVADMIK